MRRDRIDHLLTHSEKKEEKAWGYIGTLVM